MKGVSVPYIIKTMNGKPFSLQVVFTEEEIDRLRGDGNTYVIVNTQTRRRSTVNKAVRARRGRGAAPAASE
jgi:hypothetical protein